MPKHSASRGLKMTLTIDQKTYTIPGSGLVLRAAMLGERQFLRDVNKSRHWPGNDCVVTVEHGYLVRDGRLVQVEWVKVDGAKKEWPTIQEKGKEVKRATAPVFEKPTDWTEADLKPCEIVTEIIRLVKHED